MTLREQFEAIRSQKDGPIKKFQLIKVFGADLKLKHGFDPRFFGCARLEREIQTMLKQS